MITEEQRAAAHAGPEGAHLIAAGPGTGKTFTMVERFRWLVREKAVPADAILAVTFTEAAATELRDRLTAEFGLPLEEAWIGTFHGVCARLLREHAYLVGIPREIRVMDDIDQRLLVERLQSKLRSGAESGVEMEGLEALNPAEVSDLIKDGPRFALSLKGRGIGPAEFKERALGMHAGQAQTLAGQPSAQAEKEAIELLHNIYAAYEAWLREEGRMDFDDLILATIAALKRVPEFQERCRRRFRYLVVDEFQDTNRIQLELIQLLGAEGFANVAVVGDAKQSIYGWRDAEIENIRSRFPGYRLPLTVNRRSYQEILDLATAFIRRDALFAEEPELLASRGSNGACTAVVMASSARHEARLVCAEVRRLVEAGRAFSDIALLTHSVKNLPREFEEELRRHDIPYVTSGGSGFFDREEVKDVVALLRLTADPMDDGALVRVLQGPVVRVDDAAMYRLACRRLDRRGMRLRDCFDQGAAEDLDPETAHRAAAVLAVADRLGEARDALTVADVLNRLLEETGYLRHCQLRAAREGPRAVMNLRKVFRMASRFERDAALAGMVDFVSHLDHIMEATIPIGEAEVEAADAVRLLTIHGAKGLQFPVVFLVNVRPPNPRDTERLFFDPDGFGFVMKWWRGDRHPRFRENLPGAAALALARQERRRAVYVALTRAQDALYVSATRDEASAEDVSPEDDDHFGEILGWALAHPEAAAVIQAEQPELPELEPPAAPTPVDAGAVEEVLARLERIQATGPARPPEAAGELRLSFSQLHQFEVCPVRYRFAEVWRVPAPPDELLPRQARGTGAADLGAAVHSALAAWHTSGGDLLGLYDGPDAGREMLAGYLARPLASAPTLGAEVEFNLRLGQTRLKGVVDRVCSYEGRTALVDYKTNARLDRRLLEAYSTQLRLYGLAARAGLLPGADPDPRLFLFDLRKAEAIEVAPDPEAAEALLGEIARRIGAGDFELRPEHADRPCFLCSYRPICPSRR